LLPPRLSAWLPRLPWSASSPTKLVPRLLWPGSTLLCLVPRPPSPASRP
jgi:hypothetical protein